MFLVALPIKIMVIILNSILILKSLKKPLKEVCIKQMDDGVHAHCSIVTSL